MTVPTTGATIHTRRDTTALRCPERTKLSLLIDRPPSDQLADVSERHLEVERRQGAELRDIRNDRR
jgi:hypothetical protein